MQPHAIYCQKPRYNTAKKHGVAGWSMGKCLQFYGSIGDTFVQLGWGSVGPARHAGGSVSAPPSAVLFVLLNRIQVLRV